MQHPPSDGKPAKVEAEAAAAPDRPELLNNTTMAEETILKELQEIKAIALLAAKPILTMKEAAAFLGVSMAYLYKLVCAKKVPYYKSAGGKMTYFDREELTQWLKAVRVPTDEELQAQAVTHSVMKGGAK